MRLFPRDPPPGPFRREFWSSPLRGPWLTAFLGTILLALVAVVAVTGFLSHAAYNPDLPGNAIVEPGRDLPFVFDWPTSPVWLYAFTQGLHTTVGLAAIPVLLAKLWSVFPRLFVWPPAESPAQAIERLGLALLVASALFVFATGVVNVQLYYPFKFNFVVAHYYGSWVFLAALTLHVLVKLPVIRRAYATQGVLKPLKQRVAQEPADDLVATAPDPPSLSRRGLLALVGAGSALVALNWAGQVIGGPARQLSLLAPRRRVGPGPNGFQVNKTAAAVGVGEKQTGASWRLRVEGARTVELTRDQLLAMPQHTEDLPIACVEGWTTTQRWTGVRLRDLAELAGHPDAGSVFVDSLQRRGAFRQVTLSADQVSNPRSLLALRVNGVDLSLDHGYPARIMVPAQPGVHQTKWVGALTFAPPERSA